MHDKKYFIKDLQIKDIPQAMDLVIAEGWNQKPKDWELFINNPNNTCKSVLINNKIVGTTVSYHFSPELLWISMVLVDKKFRGQGISKQLMKVVLEEMEECSLIKLDATEAGRNIYLKFGFEDEINISRLMCPAIDFPIDQDTDKALKIKQSDLLEIATFDGEVFGVNRIQLLDSWLRANSENSWMLAVDGKISGMALGRQGNRFFQIGPVSASNVQDARILISRQLKNLKGKPVVIDVVNSKSDLMDWLYKLGFEKKREFTRMYKGTNTESRLYQNYYCIGGPEFG